MKFHLKYIIYIVGVLILLSAIIYLILRYFNTDTIINSSDVRKLVTGEIREKFTNHFKCYRSREAEPWEKNTTILVKTFLRPECILRLVFSIRKYYSHVPIIIVDDSEEKLFEQGQNILNILSIHMPYYSGVSQGRNEGVKHIKTKYTILLDDDMLFTHKSKMSRLYEYLEQNPNTTLISAKLSDRGPYRALFERTPTELKIHNDKYLYQQGPVTYSHRALNCFMCRTQLLVNVPWDNNLKTEEHTEHFYRIYLNGYNVCDHSEVEIVHTNNCTNNRFGYRFFRNIGSYSSYIATKHGVNKFGDMIISDKQKKFAKTLSDMADGLNKRDIKFVLSRGTALGVYREMQFIEHDPDIDLVVMRKDIRDERDLMNIEGFTVYRTFGTLENGLKYTHQHIETGVNIDIFVMYEEEHYNWYGAWNDVQGMEEYKVTKLKYPKYNVLLV